MKSFRLLSLFLVIVTVVSFGGCASKEKESHLPKETETTKTTEMINMTYEQISQKEAKRIMDTESDYIIIDARTQEEFDEGHIEGAILIPEYEIAEKAPDLIPDKNQLILVYCRSGRRSKIASEALVQLGYTNVKEFGGIIDWEYEIVK
ncbi:MAG: rhodanese-like domain-containing protein [Clostridia bacterium]|nr:rhodanese-like domain-containing protein [Clostridia bacterium]